jgi:hypothetical protein
VRVERTESFALISAVCSELWDEINEGDIAIENWRPDTSQCWLKIDDEGVIGLYNFVCLNSVTLEAHPLILREHRGTKAVESAKVAFDWIKENTEYHKVICWVPEELKHVKRFALTVGFKVEGFCPDSFLRNGKVQGRWLLGYKLR